MKKLRILAIIEEEYADGTSETHSVGCVVLAPERDLLFNVKWVEEGTKVAVLKAGAELTKRAA